MYGQCAEHGGENILHGFNKAASSCLGMLGEATSQAPEQEVLPQLPVEVAQVPFIQT